MVDRSPSERIWQANMAAKGEIPKTNYVKRMVEVYEGKHLTNPYVRFIQGSQALFGQGTIDFDGRNGDNVSQELFNKRSAGPDEVSKSPTRWNTAGTLRDWRPIQSKNDRYANAHGMLRLFHDTVKVDSGDEGVKQTASSIFSISSDVDMNVDIYEKATIPLSPSPCTSRNDGDIKNINRSRLFPNLSRSNINELNNEIKEIWSNLRKSNETKRRIGRCLFSPGKYVRENENNMIICSSPTEPIMDNTISSNYDDSDESLIDSKRHDSINSYKNLQINIYDFEEERKKKTNRQHECTIQQAALDPDQLQCSFTSSHSDTQTLKSLDCSYISPPIYKNNTLMPRTSSKGTRLTLNDYIVNGKQCSQDKKSICSTSFYHRSTTDSRESMDDSENTSVNWTPIMENQKHSRKKSIKKLLSLFTKTYPSKINRIFLKGRSKKRSQDHGDSKYSTFVPLFSSPSCADSTISLSSNVLYGTPSTLPTFDTFRPRASSPPPLPPPPSTPTPRHNQQDYADVQSDNKSRLILTDSSHKDLRTNVIPFYVSSHSTSMAVNKFPQSHQSPRDTIVMPDVVVSSHEYPPLLRDPQLSQNIPKHPYIRTTQID